MKRLALLGASGHGKVVADMALLSGWDDVSFFDDAWPQCEHNGPWRVEGDTAALIARLPHFAGVVVSIGDCKVRWHKHKTLLDAGAQMASIVHPAAIVSPRAVLGVGTVVMAGAVVNIDAVVGQAAIINTGASVDHDCHLGDSVHVSPGAHLAGGVRVGEGAWLGIGATVKQGIEIGNYAVVGAGAVVLSSVSPGVTVIGYPARPKALNQTPSN